MLDAFIIEELKRIEEEKADADRPFLELPIPMYDPQDNDKKKKNNIIVIDLC